MLKTYLYVPEELKEKIIRTAKAQNKSKAEIMRQALREGIESLRRKQASGAEVLLELAELAKKNHVSGPKDGSINHDYYLWGFPKKDPKIKP